MPPHKPNSATELIHANLRLLHQIRALLCGIDSVCFTTPSPVLLDSAIGGHVRHCLDHYSCLLAGLMGGRVDYDQRERNTAVEKDLTAALAKLGEVEVKLSELSDRDCSMHLEVKMDHGAADGDCRWEGSSLGRELQFLISHTVHHQALMSGLCHLHGMEKVPDAGFAPSTLRYKLAAAHNSTAGE